MQNRQWLLCGSGKIASGDPDQQGVQLSHHAIWRSCREMTVRFVRPVSQSAYTGRRLGFSALLLFVIILVAHRFGPLSEPHFIALLLLAAAIAAASLPFSIIGLMRLWQVAPEAALRRQRGLSMRQYLSAWCWSAPTTIGIFPPFTKSPPISTIRPPGLPRRRPIRLADPPGKPWPRRAPGAVCRLSDADRPSL